MTIPSLSDLYLAYRQAKTALYYERRGVGLLEIARYEENLSDNLSRLQAKLARGAWFDNLAVGEVWVVPKRLDPTEEKFDDVVRIGVSSPDSRNLHLNVNLMLSPSPEFAIVEVLYLWAFGPNLEKVLSRDAMGYRLDLKQGVLGRDRRWIFQYWPRWYQAFRSEPLRVARRRLARNEGAVLLVSADLASFYDTIDPHFMLSQPFFDSLEFDPPNAAIDYLQATSSLLNAIKRFQSEAGRRVGLPVTVGIPIGSLTSRVIANLSLATLDSYVRQHERVLEYRRYVDDLVIVASSDSVESLNTVARTFLPLRSSEAEEVLSLDVDRLERPGSEFQLQRRKIKIHHLDGVPGQDFVEAVMADFDRLVSRSQAFLDPTALLEDGAKHLVRATDGEGSPLRVLRDADRSRLERFALSTSLRTLERVSVLVDPEEARGIVRNTLERVSRALNSDENWVQNLDVLFRILRLAVRTADQESCRELIEQMESIFKSTESLKSKISTLIYRCRPIDPERVTPWVWLRNYLQARRLEAVCSTVPLDLQPSQLRTWPEGGLTFQGKTLQAVAIRRRAEALAIADLRSHDREDDMPPEPQVRMPEDWMEPLLAESSEIEDRMGLIRKFVDVCKDLGDKAWIMPPARLFLCTRPPSYFDIARRLLYRLESGKFSAEIFERLLRVVNAIRGTRYADPVGTVGDNSTIYLPWADDDGNVLNHWIVQDPRLALGNLVARDEFWKGAATPVPGSPDGRPVLTISRLKGLNHILKRATRASSGRGEAGKRPTLLVLPELSIPRRWFRPVALHIVRDGGFGAIIGLEYLHDVPKKQVVNQAFAVLPGPFHSVATWPWTKGRPAVEERRELERLGLSLRPAQRSKKRIVVDTIWGTFSVLICSELIESRQVADLLGRAELILCPAWNPDTSSYDHLIQSVGFQLHAIIAIANNGHYSDCRAWAPRTERWERDLCRLIQRDVDDIVTVDLPLQSLIRFHRSNSTRDRKNCPEGCEEKRPEWRPLPPDWP